MNSADPTLLYGGNASFVEGLYEDYMADPTSVEPEWRAYFASLRNGQNGPETAHSAVQRAFAELASKGASARVATVSSQGPSSYGSSRLINAYRLMGHLEAATNPLSLRPKERISELEPGYYGLTEADLNNPVTDGAFSGSVRDVLAAVQETYTRSIGFEFAHLPRVEREWLQNRIEANRGRGTYDAGTKKRILEKLTAAEGLEKYLHVKYVGAKRFSLEGGDATIPMLDQLIQSAGAKGVKEVMVGMAHRGRLNVLINIFGKKSKNLFDEFEGKQEQLSGLSGDVKYHIGFSSEIDTPGGSVHLALAFNPSHLELVDPVVEGSCRARQDRRGDTVTRDSVLPILIHGDAALVGQGIVPETLNLSQLRGYATGGTVHLVINNQVGFTISEPQDARSGRYTTDIAKFIDAPVFHVNEDDPEACVYAMLLALEYRMAFHKDAFVDLVCYRRHGHNEGDEPRVTQPAMYRQIDAHKGTRALYAAALEKAGLIADGDAQKLSDAYRDKLDAGLAVADAVATDPDAPSTRKWEPFIGQTWTAAADTGVSVERLKALGEQLTQLPEGFKVHNRVDAILKSRKAMAKGEQPLDWGMGENLAYATLLTEGYGVRITGQDVGRGTFFHRHAVFHNQNAERDEAAAEYSTLKHLSADQGRLEIYDSSLSELAVLGFEYGYAATEPNSLVIWEAQFGDFANGAQAMIDQYISSGEVKWRRLSGVVMMLPHGFEGQGPEHSSARLERYLQLCAEENMQVVVPSTPAQIFHLLRRQMVRAYRKPLVILTPKSLLRHKQAVSSLEELAGGHFQNVIPDATVPARADRVVLCAGKVYYELIEARAKHNLANLAIVRVEQLHPFPTEEVKAELAKHPGAQVIWTQEEPKNQGAWYFVQEELRPCLATGQTLSVSSRPASASPATGYPSKHVEQQQTLINLAVGLPTAVEEPVVRDPQFTG